MRNKVECLRNGKLLFVGKNEKLPCLFYKYLIEKFLIKSTGEWTVSAKLYKKGWRKLYRPFITYEIKVEVLVQQVLSCYEKFFYSGYFVDPELNYYMSFDKFESNF